MKFFCNGVRHLFDHVVVHEVSFLEIKTAGSVVTEPAVQLRVDELVFFRAYLSQGGKHVFKGQSRFPPFFCQCIQYLFRA
jgi:hypothetical protein